MQEDFASLVLMKLYWEDTEWPHFTHLSYPCLVSSKKAAQSGLPFCVVLKFALRSSEPTVTPHCFCRIIGWTRVRVAVLNSRLLHKAVGLWFLCWAPAPFSVVFRLWRDETQFWGNCGSSSPLGLFCSCFHVNTLTTLSFSIRWSAIIRWLHGFQLVLWF